ncbi:hypothetical protein HN51_004603 [Arachis hypogaea]
MQYQSLVYSDASNRNEQHDMEINSARVAAEEDVAKNSKDLFEQFDGPWQVMLKQADGSYACIAESTTRFTLGEDFDLEASSVWRS